MGAIEHVVRSISVVLHERLPWQRKTQREKPALLVATMLSERSATLMSLAAVLPRQPGRIDMRDPWIMRVLANPLIECDAVMLPFAREVLARALAEADLNIGTTLDPAQVTREVTDSVELRRGLLWEPPTGYAGTFVGRCGDSCGTPLPYPSTRINGLHELSRGFLWDKLL